MKIFPSARPAQPAFCRPRTTGNDPI